MLEMQKEQLRIKVNAVYGYNAIARIRITQTAASGFAEGKAHFDRRPEPKPSAEADPDVVRQVNTMTAPISDQPLRSALDALGRNVFSKQK